MADLSGQCFGRIALLAANRAFSAPSAEPVNQCAAALTQSDEIEFGGNTASAVILGGMQVSWGEWRNLRTGSHGRYSTRGVGLGAGLGITRDYGKAKSLADFVGYGETGSAGAAWGPVGAGYSVTENAFGEVVAKGGGLGWSPPIPGLGYKKLGLALTATAGETSISNCHYIEN